MWCSNCQQDVPGISHAVSGRLVCSRCQRAATTKSLHAARICDEGIALDEPSAATMAAAPPLRDVDWSHRQRVRHLGRELRRPSVAGTAARRPSPAAHAFHSSYEPFPSLERVTTPHIEPTPLPASTAALVRSRRTDGAQVFSWLVVALGTLALAAGIGLIGWSLNVRQLNYWNLALGLTLGGQGMLIFGLVLVVSRLWRSSRHAGNKLHEVHARLGQLQHTTEALTAARAGGSPAFYVDLVRGASPHVLLANLKGQVDQLAAQLGNFR